MRHCLGMTEPTSLVLEQNRGPRPGAEAPCELPLCKLGLRPFPVFVLFRPVIDGNPGRAAGAPIARISCCHPGAYGKATGASCARPPVFLLLFTGKQGHRMGRAASAILDRR